MADKKYQKVGKVGKKHFGVCYANLYEMLPQTHNLSKYDIDIQDQKNDKEQIQEEHKVPKRKNSNLSDFSDDKSPKIQASIS